MQQESSPCAAPERLSHPVLAIATMKAYIAGCPDMAPHPVAMACSKMSAASCTGFLGLYSSLF